MAHAMIACRAALQTKCQMRNACACTSPDAGFGAAAQLTAADLNSICFSHFTQGVTKVDESALPLVPTSPDALRSLVTIKVGAKFEP